MILARVFSNIYREGGIILIDSKGQKYICGNPKKDDPITVKLLKENLEVTISFMEEEPVSIELPNNIECTIESTDAAIKNQTASSSYKPALLDCGIRIDVPPFIESGEKVIVDTRTLEYVKRVN